MTATTHEAVVSCRLAYHVLEPATVVLNVAASRVGQVVIDETWQVDRDDAVLTELDGEGVTRLHRLVVQPGPLSVRYQARVGLPAATHSADPGPPPAAPDVSRELLSMLLPSRYAPSDRVTGLAASQFGDLDAGAPQALALAGWIHRNVAYVSGSTAADDSALETVLKGQGVCRDFAHVGVAFARALDIPARYVSVYAPLLDPPDFHAVFEVHLGGRWWVIDPTRLAPRASLVRIGTGRDAVDCAFATILGGHVDGQAVEVAAHTIGPPPADDHTDLIRPDALD